ncbi:MULTISPECIES: cell envelope integrity protein TolA [unclassified Variovorax]|uniref:cell envelope integrity protein TolA n=1 Tax=unclassified Variovorax TaxID=663243 RepID=UPI00076D32B1|nr:MULTISPECIES: cell envelope integrity protein TolA [unclassified Variovorax]KWT84386.1 Translation initiation factor 2 [Variovorax sp. WDL1]PNG52875.1 IgA-specific serine endopeptidase autotransporter [Variovorax sp. B4]PNG55412.1 IgA-specific serine endopeptidase autotransporter [Variovorax sp. B2]VTV09179.1 IgA-specific serine endopeptidase autotransporter precursor [Variovorax sp. WDL1]
MSLAADRPEFAPPPQRGTFRAVLLALIAHALLIIALTWGVSWRREAENDAVEAELWSSTIQQAAPRAVAPTPPAPAPAPTPAPPPPPPPPPPPQAARPPEPAPPPPKQPDIALEREKKLKEQKEREREEEVARQQQQKKLEAARKAAQEKKEQEAKERERERAEEEAERKKEQQQKLAEAKKKQEAEAAAKKKEAEAKAAAQAAADRAATLKRMQAMAGTGGEGNAARSSGPSGSYGGKVAAAVRPNVVFPEAELVSGNPGAEFDVRLAPDGTIVGTPALVKTSGLPHWDEAALRALQKTEKLPRDVDGTVPPRLTVVLRPKR